MDSRERFLKALAFEAVDKVPLPCLFYPMHYETVRRWQRDGMSRDVHPIAYFGLERAELMPIHVGPLPHYERAHLEEAEEWRLGVDRDLKPQVAPEIAVAEEQSPIRTTADWERFKVLLNPASPARYPRFWDDYVRHARTRDYPLGISVGSVIGWLLEWMGATGLTNAWQSEPTFVARVMDEVTDFVTQVLERAVTDLPPDFAMLWEGAVYRALPLLESEGFTQTLSKSYRKLADWLDGKGVCHRIVHAAGRLDGLVRLWVETGWTVLAPLEATGVDALTLRHTYGKNLALIGNIDRRCLAATKREVNDEVRRIRRLYEQGGYIPAPDGTLLPDIPLDNFRYYFALLQTL